MINDDVVGRSDHQAQEDECPRRGDGVAHEAFDRGRADIGSGEIGGSKPDFEKHTREEFGDQQVSDDVEGLCGRIGAEDVDIEQLAFETDRAVHESAVIETDPEVPDENRIVLEVDAATVLDATVEGAAEIVTVIGKKSTVRRTHSEK